MRDPLTLFSKRALRRRIVALEGKIEALLGERESLFVERENLERLIGELRRG